jgi:hypothetical protein
MPDYFVYLEGRLERGRHASPANVARHFFGDAWADAYWKPAYGPWPMSEGEKRDVIDAGGWCRDVDDTTAAVGLPAAPLTYAILHYIEPKKVCFVKARTASEAGKIAFPTVVNQKVLEYKVCPLITTDQKKINDWCTEAGADPYGWLPVDCELPHPNERTSRKAKMVSLESDDDEELKADELKAVKIEAIHRLLDSGMATKDIAAALGLKNQQVAAIKAHATMGTYNGSTKELRRQVERHFKKLGY